VVFAAGASLAGLAASAWGLYKGNTDGDGGEIMVMLLFIVIIIGGLNRSAAASSARCSLRWWPTTGFLAPGSRYS
jgi:branched-subunit amino acid ABC-type transport system permease component